MFRWADVKESRFISNSGPILITEVEKQQEIDKDYDYKHHIYVFPELVIFVTERCTARFLAVWMLSTMGVFAYGGLQYGHLSILFFILSGFPFQILSRGGGL